MLLLSNFCEASAMTRAWLVSIMLDPNIPSVFVSKFFKMFSSLLPNDMFHFFYSKEKFKPFAPFL